jgi:hypothetical protein
MFNLNINNKKQDCKIGTVGGGGWMNEIKVTVYGRWTA